MPASSTKVAVAAVAVVLLGLAGHFGWQRFLKTPEPAAQLATAKSGPVPGAVEDRRAEEDRPREKASAGTMASIAPGGPPPSSAGGSPGVRNAPAAATAGPSFDIVRVEPNGDALLAGRSKPNDEVALIDHGKVVAKARADDGGNFVMTPPTLKPGDYSLSLREGQGATANESKQSVVVSVPVSKKEPVVVAMAEPGRATKLLSAPPEAEGTMAPTPSKPSEAPASDVAPKASAPSVGSKLSASSGAATATSSVPTVAVAPPKLAIRSVELENGSGLFLSGVAPPGTDVRVYLNDSRVADVIAAAAGAWSVEVRKGLTAGRYAVRADALKSDKTVAARAEVPFDVPAPMTAGKPDGPSMRTASAAAPAKVATDTAPALAPARITADAADRPATGSPAPQMSIERTPANAVIDELGTELVSRGDNLWRISRQRLGYGRRYTQIYAVNATQIRDPNLIYPGQVFVMPVARN